MSGECQTPSPASASCEHLLLFSQLPLFWVELLACYWASNRQMGRRLLTVCLGKLTFNECLRCLPARPPARLPLPAGICKTIT